MSETFTQNPILQLKEASKIYSTRQGNFTALDSMNLSLYPGENLGIIGESGAGKTTVLKLLTGLITPTSGEVLFNGKNLELKNREQVREFRSLVQLVFQDPRSALNPRMKVQDIIAEPLLALKSHSNVKARVAEVLESVGLDTSFMKRYPAEFSGGQRQRIAIARALAPNPKVLVADEPVSALDVSIRAQIINLLAKISKENDVTLAVVSHDIAIVHQLCQQTMIMQNGRLVESGSTEQILTQPSQPYTKKLLQAVPRLPQS